MRLQLSSAVYEDLREILEYYDETADRTVADGFYQEFRQYVELAARSPKSYPIYLDDPDQIRRVNLRRFPYHFLFRQVDANTIRVLVVSHDHRHPSYGLERW